MTAKDHGCGRHMRAIRVAPHPHAACAFEGAAADGVREVIDRGTWLGATCLTDIAGSGPSGKAIAARHESRVLA